MAIDMLANKFSVDSTADKASRANVGLDAMTKTAAPTKLSKTEKYRKAEGDKERQDTEDTKEKESFINIVSTRCEYEYRQKINRVSCKVINRDTDEVIREIPSEHTLKMAEKLYELSDMSIDERR